MRYEITKNDKQTQFFFLKTNWIKNEILLYLIRKMSIR